MMGIKDNNESSQVEFISLENLVPTNHLVRKLDAAMDFSFIYDLVQDLYKPYGRESIDPVVLVKITFIQYIWNSIHAENNRGNRSKFRIPMVSWIWHE